MVEFTINHRVRDVLGGRSSALEVMNDRKPATTINLSVWAGVKMKDNHDNGRRVDQHCVRLENSLTRLHEEVLNLQEGRQ